MEHLVGIYIEHLNDTVCPNNFVQATTDPTQASTNASKTATATKVKSNQGSTQTVQIQVITSQTGVQQGKANPL